jgi:small subunit ribosomal protein S7
MPRRTKIEPRVPVPDSKYNSELVSRFINKLMERGKKGLAERMMYDALALVEERSGRGALEVFEQAVTNATPFLEVKPRRVGGATYQVPVQIEGRRRQSLAIRWILTSARGRSGRTMTEKLANELLDATIKRREDTHRMAEANRAFAHYRY